MRQDPFSVKYSFKFSITKGASSTLDKTKLRSYFFFSSNAWRISTALLVSRTRGKLLKLGRNYLKKNNVLVLEFDKYGILVRKEFYNKDQMNKIKFAKNETENELRKENFIYSFLSSVRQKMMTKTK